MLLFFGRVICHADALVDAINDLFDRKKKINRLKNIAESVVTHTFITIEYLPIKM